MNRWQWRLRRLVSIILTLAGIVLMGLGLIFSDTTAAFSKGAGMAWAKAVITALGGVASLLVGMAMRQRLVKQKVF